MDRKEFLENFLRCVDTGASPLDFRRYARVKAQHLPRHMRQIDAYRKELADLQEDVEEAEAPDSKTTQVLPAVLCGNCGLGGCSGGCIEVEVSEPIAGEWKVEALVSEGEDEEDYHKPDEEWEDEDLDEDDTL